MNPFLQHPTQQGISYLEHADFAISIAGRLLASVISGRQINDIQSTDDDATSGQN